MYDLQLCKYVFIMMFSLSVQFTPLCKIMYLSMAMKVAYV